LIPQKPWLTQIAAGPVCFWETKLGADKDFERGFKLDETLRVKFEGLVNQRKRQLSEKR
jgi:hypothetical protein